MSERHDVRWEVVAVSERCPKCGANASDHYLAEGDIDRIRDVLWRADAYMMAYGEEQLGGHAPRQSAWEEGRECDS